MSLPPAPQSALAPHGPEAAGIFDLTLVLVAGAAAIFALVLALAWLAWRRPRPGFARNRFVISGGIVFPMVTLAALMAYGIAKDARLALAGAPEVTLEVVGHQWWWEVRYLDAAGGHDFTTANEIRLPAGARVELRVRSADVLHSFWVPALAGKLDLVPGRENRLQLVADRAGTYRGQCAEYCGGPHALMALYVVAEEPARFEAWRSAQRKPQAPGAAGEKPFLEHCAACHSVRGTRAEGRLGPDLTHVASRLSLGAGILPNDPASAARFIAKGQHVKPGNLMPEFATLEPAELRALVDYVGSLR